MPMTDDTTVHKDLKDRLISSFHPQVPLWECLFNRVRPQGLGPVRDYSPFTTLVLMLARFHSPYWGPRRYLEETLGLKLRPHERGTPVCFWKRQERGHPVLVTYPVYNLDQVDGDKSQIVPERGMPESAAEDTSQIVRHLLTAMPAGPTVVCDARAARPAYNIHGDTLTLRPQHLERPTPTSDYQILEALVAATVSRTGRTIFPPAREVFVSGLATAFVALDCNFRNLPTFLPGEPELCRAWIRDAKSDLLQAAFDVEEADETARGWAGRAQAQQPDYEADSDLAT